jgi:hypothetical protein
MVFTYLPSYRSCIAFSNSLALVTRAFDADREEVVVDFFAGSGLGSVDGFD